MVQTQATSEELHDDARRWYEHGDTFAARRVWKALERTMQVAGLESLAGDLDEQRAEVLTELLDRERRLLLGVADPRAFARCRFVNRARTVLRKHRRRRALADRFSADLDPPQAPDEDARLESRRALSRVERALANSKPRDRVLLYLAEAVDVLRPGDVEAVVPRGMALPTPPASLKEIGRVLEPGSSEATAQNTVGRALRRLQEKLRSACGGEEA